MFRQSESSPRMNQTLNFISSVWEGNHIEKINNNQWKCLWCDKKSQRINSTRALACVLVIRVAHIKSCFTEIDKHDLSRYKDLRK